MDNEYLKPRRSPEQEARIKQLQAMPEWPVINAYTDYMCNQAINSHMRNIYKEKIKEDEYQLEMRRLAYDLCVDYKIKPSIVTSLELNFLDENDIKRKLSLIKKHR